MGLEQLKCKSCGSSDLSLKEGLYTCNYCGAKHYMDNDSRDINIKIDCNFDIDTQQDDDDFPAYSEPEPHTQSSHPVLKGFMYVVGFFIVCSLFGMCKSDNEVATKPVISLKQTKQLSDYELITKEHPAMLFGSDEDVKRIYDGYGDKVILDSNKYGNKTIIVYSAPVPVIRTEPRVINNIEICTSHFDSNINVEEALKISNRYLPWGIVEEYYKFDETRCTIFDDGKKKENYYDVKYVLKDKYNSYYKPQKHQYPGTVNIRITENNVGKVEHIRVATLLNDVAARSSNNYKATQWKPLGLHVMPKEVDATKEFWELLTNTNHPKLIGNYDDMLVYAKKFGEEYIFSEMRLSREKYGYKHSKNVLCIEGYNIAEKNRVVCNININFEVIKEEKKVSLKEAIGLVKNFLPYDLMNKYYTYNFARKKEPTLKNLHGTTSYQVVYDRLVTTENKAEVRKLDLPENIQIFIEEDINGNIASVSLHCFRYIPKDTTVYEETKDADGNIVEIEHKGRKLGPYEGSDKWYTVSRWTNPF